MKRPLAVGDRAFEINGVEYVTKQVPNRPYWVSRCGEIISTVSGEPKVLKGGTHSTGYRMATITAGGMIEHVRHHHVVMHYWVGPRPAGMVINHKNGIKTDNRLENLEYCTPRENRDHAKAFKLYPSGDRCSWSKLTSEAVEVIRRANAVGLSANRLAKAFDVDKKSILNILDGKTWAVEAPRKG